MSEMAWKKSQWNVREIWAPTCIGGSSKKFSFNGEAVQADCLKIERNIDKHFAKNKKQATIKDSFKLQYQYGVQIHAFKSSNTFFVFVYSICAIFIPSVIRIFAILNKISGLLRARNNERLLYNILKNSDTTFIQNIEVNQVVDLRVNNISEHIWKHKERDWWLVSRHCCFY